MLNNDAIAIPEITQWLQQFDPEDKDLAFEFVKCLEFVPADTFSRYIHEKILSQLSDRHIAVFACRKLPMGRSLFDNAGDIISLPAVGHGSEDIVSSSIRNIARTNDKILNNPSIAEMRENSVQQIIIVDDIIGSGERLKDFINAFFMHSSMKSWFSLKHSRINIISYAYDINSTKQWHQAKIGKLCFNKKNDRLSKITLSHEVTLDKGNGFKKSRLFFDDIISLCKRYANLPMFALGHLDSISHVIFSHSCPDNVPCIVWDANSWTPLFRGRVIPPDLFANMKNYSVLWQPHIIQQINAIIPTFMKDKIFYEVFFCITETPQLFSIPDHILLRCATISGYSISTVKDIAQKAIAEGYFDKDLILTPSGEDLLKFIKRKKKHIEIPPLSDILYVPII